MSKWIDIIEKSPSVEPVDDRNDWYRSSRILVKDTNGVESIATYYTMECESTEIWWDYEGDDITTSLIRYWQPIK